MEQVLFAPPASGSRPAAFLKAFGRAALDLVFPPHCIACERPLSAPANETLCRPCADQIAWIGPDRCGRCGSAAGAGAGLLVDCAACRAHPPVFVEAACAAGRYQEGPMRQTILAWKFGARQHAARVLGLIVAQRIRTTALACPEMLVAPVPLARAALRTRGFNQVAELAYWVARELHLELHERLLHKIRDTRPQALLDHQQRRQNLKGAFACKPEAAARLKGRPVLLLDDVITTGSTVSECARVLVKAGLGPVRAAAIARS